ncbi:hypothetical protein JCM19239_1564 [Vibrio variabilis]|uniref:Uncharacterized protein n=1 Tax=Vibrio variabilis TaxID=990271 RepID=A0ABQ0JI86_9VIBR|nr:hypothetical protein JCM19239_1564 [Vibrio variabilis]
MAAPGIGIKADTAVMKSDVPAVCAVTVERSDNDFDTAGKADSTVKFAAFNNINKLAEVRVTGHTELELMAHLDGAYDKSSTGSYQVEAARAIKVTGMATNKDGSDKKLNTSFREIVKDGGSRYYIETAKELVFHLEAKRDQVWRAGNNLETVLIAEIDCE